MYLLEDVDPERSPRRLLLDVLSGAIFPNEQAVQLKSVVGDTLVWSEQASEQTNDQKASPYHVSPDLAGPVRELFSGGRPNLLARSSLSRESSHVLRFGDLPNNNDLSKMLICLELSVSG